MRPLIDWLESKRKYSGDVFILLSGPSANDFPLEKYKKYPFIAVNGSVSKLLEHGVQPLFYIGTDVKAIESIGEVAAHGARLSINCAFSKSVYSYLHVKCKESHCLHELEQSYRLEKSNRITKAYGGDRVFALKNIFDKELIYRFSFFSQNKNRIGFSTNLAKGYYCARTIGYTAVQLAKHLGFNRVFIIGLDLTEEKRFYDSDENSAPSTLSKNYDRFIYPSFLLMRDKVIDESFVVYNLSTTSRLPDNVLIKKFL